MSRFALIIALCMSSPAAAWLDRPFINAKAPRSWSPARQTSPVDDWTQQQVAIGQSPRPTAAPKPLVGRMLVPRQDEFDLGPATCGYISSNGDSFTCISSGATCTSDDSHLGCCEPNQDCNIIKTTCFGYNDVQDGKCDLPDDFHTLCCPDFALPFCFTYVMSQTGKGGNKGSTYSLLACNTEEGSAVLFDYDPAWLKTHIFDSTSQSTESATSTSTSDVSSSDSQIEDAGGKSNTGAIVGGVVGGVLFLSIIAVIVFFLLRRRKKNKDAATAASPAVNSTHMSQYGPSSTRPDGSYYQSSPGGSAMYPSGVPSNFQGYPAQPQPYNPSMTAYHTQQPGTAQQGYPQYPQQHGNITQPSYQTSPASSPPPPPGTSPSPGVEAVTSITPNSKDIDNGRNGPATELPTTNPVGSAGNRAEMG